MKKQKIELELNPEEYKILLECFTLGMSAYHFYDEIGDKEKARRQAGYILGIQSRLCSYGKDFGMADEVHHDKNAGLYMLSAYSTIAEKGEELAKILVEYGEDNDLV